MATAPTKRDPLQPLAEVLDGYRLDGGNFDEHDLNAALRAAIRAALPGRQQKGNLTPTLDVARAAFVRSLRRRAGA